MGDNDKVTQVDWSWSDRTRFDPSISRRTHLFTRAASPARSPLLLPPEIAVGPDPPERNVEELRGPICRVPGEERRRRGAQLEVADVRGERSEAVEDVRGV
jgi:hypothetical protein